MAPPPGNSCVSVLVKHVVSTSPPSVTAAVLVPPVPRSMARYQAPGPELAIGERSFTTGKVAALGGHAPTARLPGCASSAFRVIVVRIRVELTVEPFTEGAPGPHVTSALDQLRARGLDIDVGPFGTTVEGEHAPILRSLEPAITASLANGATALSLHVERLRSPTDRSAAFLTALAPLLDATGARLVPPDQMRATDTPVHWQGDLVGGLRTPAAADEYHNGLDRLIEQVEQELGGPLDRLGREEKQKAARLLDERGAFRFRGAVEEVADAMDVSKVTVYNYLAAVRRNQR